MKSSHESMRINEHDGSIFIDHAETTMQTVKVPKQESDDVRCYGICLEYKRRYRGDLEVL